MKDQDKTREQLIIDLTELRQRIAELEAVEAEHKRAEAILRESEERYRQLVESSGDMIFSVDRDGVFKTAGGVRLHEFGLRPEDVVGRSLHDLFPGEESRWYYEQHLQVFESGTPMTYEHSFEFAGVTKTDLTTIYPIKKECGGTELVGVICRDITEQKRAEETLQQRNRELALLNRASQAFDSTLDLDQVFASVLEEVCHLLDVVAGSVWLVDDERNELVCRQAAGPQNEIVRSWRLALDQGIAGWTARHGESLIVPDTQQDARYFQGVDRQTGLALRSILSVPLQVKQDVIGVLQVVDTQVDRFDARDLAVLEPLAASAAVAIENARLFQAEREQRDLAEALTKAAAAINSTLAPDKVLDSILEQVERIVAGDTSSIMLMAEDGTARVARWRGHERMGLTGEQIVRIAVPTVEYPELTKMVQTSEPFVITDVASSHAGMLPEGWEWLRSHISVPIWIAGRSVGFLNVSSAQPGKFGLADAQRMRAFAGHIATALENARLHRELEGYAERLEQQVQERTAQLAAQYARSEAILQSINDGIVVTDVEGEILQSNPVAEVWLTSLFFPEDAELLQEAIRDLARRADEMPELMLELTGADLEMSAAPVVEEGADTASAAVVDIHDISPLKELDRMKTMFINNIAHELRTPITTVKSYAYLVRQTPPEDEKWAEYLDALAREADAQAQLEEEILQISRIYAGRVAVEPRPISLSELTEAAVACHRALAQERGLTLEHCPMEPAPVAPADPQQMMSVLNNLVGDAIRYTPGGGRVMVSTGKQEAEEQVWATVTVSDTGEGIPEEDLPHAFERFFREEEPLSARISDTGLRLMIAKGIVELHGGRVTVESEAGLGTTFTVWLPLADRD